jgi:endo-alpha-N-acetylgalactosaminidase
MHSKGEVSYSLGGEYESFVATIGLDDAVRPRGSVVFKVLGDGRELFHSGLITGADPSRDIRVPVNKAQVLTLAVGYGDELDLSDYADWGNARLIRPREER